MVPYGRQEETYLLLTYLHTKILFHYEMFITASVPHGTLTKHSDIIRFLGYARTKNRTYKHSGFIYEHSNIQQRHNTCLLSYSYIKAHYRAISSQCGLPTSAPLTNQDFSFTPTSSKDIRANAACNKRNIY